MAQVDFLRQLDTDRIKLFEGDFGDGGDSESFSLDFEEDLLQEVVIIWGIVRCIKTHHLTSAPQILPNSEYRRYFVSLEIEGGGLNRIFPGLWLFTVFYS